MNPVHPVKKHPEYKVSVTLRQIILHNRDIIRWLLPTTRQKEVIDLVQSNGSMTSPELAEILGMVSRSKSARSILYKLWERGYLVRKKEADLGTGGYLYRYYINHGVSIAKTGVYKRF